jgi:hypothetical protein
MVTLLQVSSITLLELIINSLLGQGLFPDLVLTDTMFVSYIRNDDDGSTNGRLGITARARH